MKFNFTPVTLEKMRSDCNKLESLFNLLDNVSDEDIKEINEPFYTACRRARTVAQEFGFNADDLEAFYKLQMWLEMYENYSDKLVLGLEKND